MNLKIILSCLFLYSFTLLASGQTTIMKECGFELNTNSKKVYVLNEDNLNCLINQDDNFILYSYAVWCPACVKELPSTV